MSPNANTRKKHFRKANYDSELSLSRHQSLSAFRAMELVCTLIKSFCKWLVCKTPKKRLADQYSSILRWISGRRVNSGANFALSDYQCLTNLNLSSCVPTAQSSPST